VCLIDHGRIVAQGSPAELRAKHSRSLLTVTTRDRAALASVAAAHGHPLEDDGDVVRIPVQNADEARAILAAHGDDVVDFEFRHGTMDDVFLALTGGEAAA
jgi:multidrug/hemolysin transport system ATP-binding protein